MNYLVELLTPATNVGMLDDLLIPPFLLDVIGVNNMQKTCFSFMLSFK